ncbi:MAG TPA: hypothetical protein VIN05_05210 [Roseovarius sp.]
MDKLLKNTAVGILIGFSVAMLAVFFLDHDVSQELKKLYVYLLSAFFSLSGAGLALLGVFATIEKQQSMRDDGLARKLDSAKAMMPNALSTFSEICAKGMRANFVISPSGIVIKPDVTFDPMPLLLSSEAVAVFRDVIENCTDEAVRLHLAAVLREHQLLIARSMPTYGLASTNNSRENYRHITHWIYLYCLVGTLFPFARGEAPSVIEGIDQPSLQSAFRVLNVYLNPQTFALYADHIDHYVRSYQRNLDAKRPGHF